MITSLIKYTVALCLMVTFLLYNQASTSLIVSLVLLALMFIALSKTGARAASSYKKKHYKKSVKQIKRQRKLLEKRKNERSIT